ncbi:MAG: CocE/NonD family hydrolase, partial [Verrucomicrobiota bacterium]
KLIDIYPDGHEAVVRDSIVMTRFHQGFDKQVPLNKGQVYKLKMDMWSTALVVNKGHRLAVHVSSSNSPKYEVHPNTFKPVMSFDQSPVANNTVHLSAQHPSHIVLPIVR